MELNRGKNLPQKVTVESKKSKKQLDTLAAKSRKRIRRHKRKVGVYYSFLTFVLLFCLVQVGFGAILNISKIVAYKAKINTMEKVRAEAEARNKELKSDAIVQSSTEAVKQSVSQDPNAIGFVSYAHMSDDVKSLNVNGVAPSDAAIADGTYELQRPFLFLTNGEPTGDVKEFIDWVLSDEGSKVLAEEKIVKSAS